MNIIPIIDQLQTYATIFNGNVAGAAEYASLVETTANIALPQAFVIYTGDEAGPNEIWTGMQQYVKTNFSVFVVTDATQDRLGFAGLTLTAALKVSIDSAIYNWNPNPEIAARGIQYVSSRLVAFDRARLHYEFAYMQEILQTDVQGWQVPSVPLTSVNTSVPFGTDTLQVNYQIPQS